MLLLSFLISYQRLIILQSLATFLTNTLYIKSVLILFFSSFF